MLLWKPKVYCIIVVIIIIIIIIIALVTVRRAMGHLPCATIGTYFWPVFT
jgi:hypothetical protein